MTAQANTSVWAKAGVMLRATADPGSPDYAVLVTPANGVVVQWRTAQGGNNRPDQERRHRPRLPQSGPNRVSRSTAYTSPDGSTWTAVPGATVTLAGLSGPILRGLAVTSHNQGTGGTVAMDTVTMVGAEIRNDRCYLDRSHQARRCRQPKPPHCPYPPRSGWRFPPGLSSGSGRRREGEDASADLGERS